MRQAMSKLNNQARLRVYTTHLVSTSFVSPAIQRAAGREVIELPNYIFALNVLYQMGIYAHVDFIRGQNCQQDNSTPGNVLSRTSAGVLARLTTMSVSGYIAGINNKMLVPSPLPAATGRSSGGIAYRRRHCDDFPFSGTNRYELLLEDIQGGDLTTRALNIGHQHGYIEFFLRQGGCVSGVSVACKMLTTLGLTIDDAVSDGSQANAGQRLIRAQGNAAALHQGWKAIQNVLEWSCGVLRISIKCWRYLVNVILMAISPAPEKQFRAPAYWPRQEQFWLPED